MDEGSPPYTADQYRYFELESAHKRLKAEHRRLTKRVNELAERSALDAIRDALGDRAIDDGFYSGEQARPLTNDELAGAVHGLMSTVRALEGEVEFVQAQLNALGDAEFTGVEICTRCRLELEEFGECACEEAPDAEHVGYVTAAEQALEYIDSLDELAWERGRQLALAMKWGEELTRQLDDLKQCTVRLRGEVQRARRVTDSRIRAGILNDLERELNQLEGTDG